MACGPAGDVVDTPSTGGYLDPGAVAEAYAALSVDEKRKLLAVEARLRRGTSLGPGELFWEALTRALLGQRRCPQDVVFTAFLIETMRSVASHDRERLKRTASLDEVSEADVARGVSSGESPHTPEEEMMAAETVRAIHAHFDGDEEARLLLLGWGADLRGKDLRELVGVDQAGLDYIIKRVRRTMGRLYPQGWQP
jgi:hypothetical protein